MAITGAGSDGAADAAVRNLTRASRARRCCQGLVISKQSVSPVSRQGCWVESASRALEPYTFSDANCPAMEY